MALLQKSTLRPRAKPVRWLLRPARKGDVAVLALLLTGWAEATDWMPPIHSLAADRRHLQQMVAEMEVTVVCRPRLLRPARPVGFLARRGHFIHALYIAEGQRGLGLGHGLLARAKAASARLELWCYEANLPARSFYRREGFREVEAGDGSGNDAGLPDLRLEWRREAQRP